METPPPQHAAPHNIMRLVDDDAEKAVLGAMIAEQAACLLCVDRLREEDFYRTAHRKIFSAIRDLTQSRRGVDELTLLSLLRDRKQVEEVGGEAYLATLSELIASTVNAVHWAEVVADKSSCRRTVKAMQAGINKIMAQESTASVLLDEVTSSITQESAKNAMGVVITPLQGVKDAFLYYEEVRKRGTKIRGIASGLIDYDAITKGWVEQTLNIVAGRPGMGKSSFAVQCAQRASIDYGVSVVIFSLEMNYVDLFLRMMSNERRIHSDQMFDAKLDEVGMHKFTAAASDVSQSKIHVVPASGWNVFQIRAMARKLQYEIGAKLFVVDYLQRMTMPKEESHERSIAATVKGLKDLAVELNAPIIALSQLNRGVEATQDRRPELNHLLASGAIEAEADTITLLYRENYYRNKGKERDDRVVEDNDLELIVAKNRNGASGSAMTRWDGRFFRIDNLSNR